MKTLSTTIVTAAILSLFALTGCTAVASTTPPPTADSEAFADPDDAVSEPAPEENADPIGAFGDAITYEDGVTLSVSPAKAYKPSEWAAGNDQAHNVVITIKVTNGSKTTLDPLLYGTMTSGGIESSQIFDSKVDGKGMELGGSPSGKILPDKSITWNEGWSVADPADLQYEISPSFDYADAIFTTDPQ